MTPDDTGEGEEPSESVLSRRELLGASATLGTAAIASATPGVGSVSAQSSTEPRIALGADYNVYDDPNGNGDLVIKHEPSGKTFRYDKSAGKWVAGTVKATTGEFGDLSINSQEPQDVNGSRSAATMYQNTTNSDLRVSVTVVNDGSGGDINSQLRYSPDGTNEVVYDRSTITGSGTLRYCHQITVPSGKYYILKTFGTGSVDHWLEHKLA